VSRTSLARREPTAEPLAREEICALAELRYRIRRFVAFSEEQARAVGLEPRQHQLLLALEALPPERSATVGALAERLVLRHHSAVELIDRLAERGLVRRVRAPADRRQIHIHMLPAGKKVLRALSVTHRDELRRMGPELVSSLHAAIGEKGQS
jgi:DNA-binding MarR family transcriptional regulator